MIKKHCQPSHCLDRTEYREALKLADVLKHFTRQRAEHSVSTSIDSPAVLTHMSDGWGSWCNSRTKSAQLDGSHLVTTRTGKFRHEFLLQRVLLRQRDDSGDRVFMLVGDPEGLGKGKGAWNVWTGSCRFMKTLREMGHRGVCANVYLMDGALHQSLSRKFIAPHKVQANLFGGGEEETLVLALQEFTFCIKCVSHGCNNGTKWGMKALASPFDTVNDAHIATTSLRHSSTAFHSNIDFLLMRYLDYVPDRSGSDDHIHAFWVALGVHPHMVDKLVQSDLHWDGARLRVHSSFQGRPRAFSELCDMVLHLMRWVDFSETRWCGSGFSGRCFFASLAGGMDGLHAILLQDPHISKEKMAGIPRATPQVRKFLAVAALSAYSTEVVGIELLEDDRFLRRGPELRSLMEDELLYLHDLPDLVWERMASLVSEDTQAMELRDSCLVAAHIGSAYLWDDSFEQLSRPPLNITQGDIGENLHCIDQGIWDPSGLDEQAKQIKACLDIGIPISRLQCVFESVRDGAASINLIEQAHASAAVMLKQHDQLQERMLRARSTIHQCRAMLLPSRVRSRVQQIETELGQLDRCEAHIKPFNAFCMMLSDNDVASILGEHRGGGWQSNERLAKGWRAFGMLPVDGIRCCERLDADLAKERRRERLALRAQCLEELPRARAVEACNAASRGVRNHVLDCALQNSELESLLAMYNGFKDDDLRRLESAVFEPIDVPDES